MTDALLPTADNFVDLLTEQATSLQDKTAFAFLGDGDNVTDTIGYAELAQRAKALAVTLRARHAPGTNVLLLYPSCIDYMVAFFGCLCAGMVAVPVFPPSPRKHNPRLEAISLDSGARAALTTSVQLKQMQAALLASGTLSQLDIVCTDLVDIECASAWERPTTGADTLAFLQYTSGSTGQPKGVMVSHGNLLHNERMIKASFQSSRDTVYVTWLPIYHDMGLIGNMLHAFWLGGTCYFMAPASFLQRPLRWLQAIDRFKATISGGPNFAYQLCADKVTDEALSELDLSSWQVAFNGAEPVRHDTLLQFARKFEPVGFRQRAWLPCYGMAESTLIATGGTPMVDPVVLNLDRAALGQRRVKLSAKGVAVVGCGPSLPGQALHIVDPDTRQLAASDHIGEIWLAGPHIGGGYWEKPDATRDTFHAHIQGSGQGPFLRTGDLGFVHDGELYVTARLKDVMIVRGVNHFPQDIEATVEAAHEALYPTGSAAFSIQDPLGERVVVVAEVNRTHRTAVDPRHVAAVVRQQVLEQHEVSLADVVLIRPGTLPKTSSGKVQRGRAKQLYLMSDLVLFQAEPLLES